MTVAATSIEVTTGVEELRERIAALVAQRQELRTSGATPAVLEQNRLKLGRSHRELCHALIARHLSPLAHR